MSGIIFFIGERKEKEGRGERSVEMVSLWAFLKSQCQHKYSPYYVPHISYGTCWEKMYVKPKPMVTWLI